MDTNGSKPLLSVSSLIEILGAVPKSRLPNDTLPFPMNLKWTSKCVSENTWKEKNNEYLFLFDLGCGGGQAVSKVGLSLRDPEFESSYLQTFFLWEPAYLKLCVCSIRKKEQNVGGNSVSCTARGNSVT